MKIWIISDTHGLEENLNIPDVDMVIHAGDESNAKIPAINNNECVKFLEWFSSLDVKYKIFTPGNHSTAIFNGLIKRKYIKDLGVTMLIDETITIEGIKMFGSPFTPTYGQNWAYNCDRAKLHKHWNLIENETDIVITHGPPWGVLDITQDKSAYFRQGGCKALLNKILEIKPKYHVFGHFHDENLVTNYGIKKIGNNEIIFINAACCDLKGRLKHCGHIIEI